ncbi:hypothetical protein AAC387_Pa03g4314 [Persea americana]
MTVMMLVTVRRAPKWRRLPPVRGFDGGTHQFAKIRSRERNGGGWPDVNGGCRSLKRTMPMVTVTVRRALKGRRLAHSKKV